VRSFLKKRTKRLLSFDAIPNIADMAPTFPHAQEQKSFGSFLQKRTFFPSKSLISLTFFSDESLEIEPRKRARAHIGKARGPNLVILQNVVWEI
jgi:hypothetical protein